MRLKMLTITSKLLIVINLIGVISCSGRGVFFRFGTSGDSPQAEPIEPIFLDEDTTTNLAQTARLGFQNSSNMTVLNYNMKYYLETVLRAHNDTDLPAYWIDLNDETELSTSPPAAVVTDQVLSRNYLHSRVIWLKFKFPFYGHMIDRVLVTNMGFVYVGTLLNPYVSKAQYIAPLMADFDVTLSPNSSVKYVDNTTHFICTWERLLLTNLQNLGEYTFQLVLGIDGKIVFNYKSVPSMSIIKPNDATVKVGMSDAFMDSTLYLNYFNTDSYDLITEYGLIQVQPVNVKSGNSIIFTMLKNCFQLTSCHECMKSAPNFNCIWCSSLERCADASTIKEAEWVHSTCPVTFKGQSMTTTCANASAHIKTELDLRPDWIGSEAEIHRSMIKFIEDENAIEMGNLE